MDMRLYFEEIEFEVSWISLCCMLIEVDIVNFVILIGDFDFLYVDYEYVRLMIFWQFIVYGLFGFVWVVGLSSYYFVVVMIVFVVICDWWFFKLMFVGDIV